MAIRIDKVAAKDLLRQEAKRPEDQQDTSWLRKIERLSELCESAGVMTHIAFLGTALLAKSLVDRVDLHAIKPNHARENPNAFSARSLCETVLVPLSAELGFHLGATGRQPLNNQPYFRMRSLGDGTPVHAASRPPFEYMLALIEELKSTTSENARAGLAAFIAVRRRFQTRYKDTSADISISPNNLVDAIITLVTENSEGGKRAQAIVAGLLDVHAGSDRITAGRINDPSRHFPGDVCIHSDDGDSLVEKSFEVRDKPVSISDVQIFVKKCIDMGVRETAVLMANDRQEPFEEALEDWADSFGVGLTLFFGWHQFVENVLFWSASPKPIAARNAVRRIRDRLIEVEASPDSISLWDSLTRTHVDDSRI